MNKVTVKKNRGDYIVTVSDFSGTTYQREYFRKDYAYSEARHIRGLIKLGKHPAVALQNLGYKLIQVPA